VQFSISSSTIIIFILGKGGGTSKTCLVEGNMGGGMDTFNTTNKTIVTNRL